MPTYKVFLQKEIVREIEITIKAEEERHIYSLCDLKTIFKAVKAEKHNGKWDKIVDEPYMDSDRIEVTDKDPEFIIKEFEGDWLMLRAPKKPKVDPRQLPLLED